MKEKKGKKDKKGKKRNKRKERTARKHGAENHILRYLLFFNVIGCKPIQRIPKNDNPASQHARVMRGLARCSAWTFFQLNRSSKLRVLRSVFPYASPNGYQQLLLYSWKEAIFEKNTSLFMPKISQNYMNFQRCTTNHFRIPHRFFVEFAQSPVDLPWDFKEGFRVSRCRLFAQVSNTFLEGPGGQMVAW